MISGCNKNLSVLPIFAILAHINVTYGVSEHLTLCGITSSSTSLQHSLTSTFTNFEGMASPATHCKFTFPICSTFMPSSNSSLITGTSAPESISAFTFIGSFPAVPRISTSTYCNNTFFNTVLSSLPDISFCKNYCPIKFLSEYQVKGDISSLTLLRSHYSDVLWLDFLNCQPLEFDSPSNVLALTLVE